MTAFLSIILAFMNILPIPALDGGHVLFLIYEIIARRKPSDKFMERAQMVGMFLLFGLLIWANFNDILRVMVSPFPVRTVRRLPSPSRICVRSILLLIWKW